MTQTMRPEVVQNVVVTAINDALEGARRATESAPSIAPPDPEVVATAKRRQFTKAEKLRIVNAANRCTERGAIGALLRREGIYASTLNAWRRQHASEGHGALAVQPRGPKANPVRAEERRNEQLTREVTRLSRRLARAETIIAAQKKLCNLLGLPAEEDLGEDI
jgi:transposase